LGEGKKTTMNTNAFSIPVRDGIQLRFIQPEEARALFELVDKNRAYLRKWLPWVHAQTGPDVSKEHILSRLEGAKKGETLDLGIYLDGALIGSMGFNRIVSTNKKASIGYWISEEFQGKGVMSDCVRALVDYGFRTLHLHRIRIQCNVSNAKSEAIPKRLGFTFEGIAREDEFLYDHFEDSKIFSMLEHEWKS
jgi:ribosomal-protein-serine acetyltransferase